MSAPGVSRMSAPSAFFASVRRHVLFAWVRRDVLLAWVRRDVLLA
ncbi:hypothetical protein L083_4841 [Actinoplanes sp. N902-109]|nr:hypothetical protein L083_4841 [Actinoplanes sp. N902-109]